MEKKDKNLNVPNLRFPEFSGEWDITTIGEISNIKNGPFGSVLHAEDYVSDGIPIVTTEHFKSGSLPIVKDGIPQVSEQDYIRLKGYKLQTNDIVFSRVGSVDINAYVSDTQNGWLFSGRVLRVRPISSVNSLCLHFVLSTEKVKQGIRSRAVGQTMPSINTPILSTTNIFLPKSLEEQRKISIFLALIDARLETQKKIIEKYESLIRGLYQFLFQQAKYDHFVSLGDISQISNGNSDVKDASMYNDGSLYPFFDRSDEIKFLPEYLFDKEAIIYPGEGAEFYPRYYNGKFALHQRCYAVYDISTDFIPRYLYHYCKTQNSYFVRNAVGSTVASLRLDTFKRLKIPVIPTHHQESLVMFLDKIEAKIECNRTILKKYEEQKKYLLSNLFI